MAGSSNDPTGPYYVGAWGAGFFGVDTEGHLSVQAGGSRPSSLLSVIDRLRADGMDLPLVLRFPQIIEDRLARLNLSFENAIAEAEYRGSYQGVYPIKVNQRRMVVETIAEHGARYKTGLEAGSKAELALILVQDIHPDALICCNGFKDDDFIRMALWGRKLGLNVVITLEKLGELQRVMRIARDMEVEPFVGVRFKLHAKGSGRWEDSGGDNAKFGLSAAETLHVAQSLKDAGMESSLRMLHCHVGSQVTDINQVKLAVREATQTYVELFEMHVPPAYLNLGGGLAVDYDGSKSLHAASANYGLQEYATTLVWTVADTCNAYNAPHPIIVTESGRALTAHHAVLVLPVVDAIGPTREPPPLDPISGEAHQLVRDILEAEAEVSAERYRQTYNEAVGIKSTMHDLYDLGYLSLLERAHIEASFCRIQTKVAEVVESLDYVPEEFDALSEELADTYICNFSVFQSLPDHWAIDQIFPIAPLQRLDETPTRAVTIADITCDSDGCIRRFADLRDTRNTLPVHELRPDEPYYLGVFLTGAYQDVLGSAHNLLGRVNEAHVVLGDEGHDIALAVPGQKARRVIENMGYETGQLHKWIVETIAESGTKLSRAQVKELIELYDSELVGYTYLE